MLTELVELAELIILLKWLVIALGAVISIWVTITIIKCVARCFAREIAKELAKNNTELARAIVYELQQAQQESAPEE